MSRMGFPCVGAWVTYGLGTESQNLPAFVVMYDTLGRGLPKGHAQNWGAGFLPGVFQGTALNAQGAPIDNLERRADMTDAQQRAQLDLLAQAQPAAAGADAARSRSWRRGSRASSWPTACRWPRPRRSTSTSEPAHIREAVRPRQSQVRALRQAVPDGPAAGRARRALRADLLAAAWRTSGAGTATRTSRRTTASSPARPTCRSPACWPISKQRGLLDSTLVIWGGEFGRLPIVQKGGTGRDHNPHAFTTWLAGGGVKGGVHYGATDEIGHKAVDRPRQRQRPARHDPAPAGPRPREAHLPLQRPRLPPDRRRRPRGEGSRGVKGLGRGCIYSWRKRPCFDEPH